MQQFKHKTRKESFRIPYFTCVAINIVGVVGWMVSRGKVGSIKGLENVVREVGRIKGLGGVRVVERLLRQTGSMQGQGQNVRRKRK